MIYRHFDYHTLDNVKIQNVMYVDKMEEYAFGPVPSRRFGNSLGVNPIPFKICSYSCIYCQLGRTKKLQIERKKFFECEEIISDIERLIDATPAKIDYISFMGDGEPTLAENLGDMARALDQIWDGGKALITNGSIFFRRDVREDAKEFDVVSPTVSAWDERSFRIIHRPHKDIKFERTMDGLRQFREEFSGELWVELMLIRGVNDTPEALRGIRDQIEQLDPARIYINAPIRPPSEEWVKKPERQSIENALEIFEKAIDMTEPEEGAFLLSSDERTEALLRIATNHPLREEQVIEILSGKDEDIDSNEISEKIEHLVLDGMLERTEYERNKYYRTIKK